MTIVMLYIAVFLGVAAFVSSKPNKVTAERESITLGVFPRFAHDITMEGFTPLSKYLSKQLGRRVRLVTTHSFAEFWKKLQNREFDIVHFNQYHYIRAKKKLNYEVVAMNEERGRSTISSSIVVRKDSGIKSIADLKGKTILFGGGPKAMISYIYATYLLKQGGLNPGDYQIRFETNPPSALIATFYHLWGAQAVGVGDVVLELPGIKKLVDTKQLAYLTVGKQYAHLPWAVKKELSPLLKKQILAAMLKLKNSEQGRKILKKARLSGFAPAKDSDFNPHRKITLNTLGENFF